MTSIENFFADASADIHEAEQSSGGRVAHIALTYALEPTDDSDPRVYTSAGDPWQDARLFSAAAALIAGTHGLDNFAGLDEEPRVD